MKKKMEKSSRKKGNVDNMDTNTPDNGIEEMKDEEDEIILGKGKKSRNVSVKSTSFSKKGKS
jgi:hypothetical protein